MAATAFPQASSNRGNTRSASAPSDTISTTRKAVEVAAQKTATLDLKLRKTEDLAAQLSNGEWINSIPGNDPQKGIALNCVGCHTLERVMRSTYNADDFMNTVLPRMQGYVNQSIPCSIRSCAAASAGWKSAAISAFRSIVPDAEFWATSI